MSADPTPANSDDCSRLCLPMAASAQANSACSRVVRTFQWSSTGLSPTRAIHHRVNRRIRDWTRNFAPFVSLLGVIAEKRADS